jgi:SPFH domain / Band 7 family
MAILGTVLALIVMIIVLYRIYLPILITWLAEENILYTTVEDGQAKIIMRGDDFDRCVMSYEGFHLNVPGHSLPRYDNEEPDWEVLADNPFAPKGFYDLRSAFEKKYGLYWVGYPWENKVYKYTFRWNETKTEAAGEDRGSESILPREAETDFVYVKDFTYVAVTHGAETKEGLPTREQTNVTVRITNPYKALFRTEDWMRRVMSPTNRIAREYVASQGYKDLLAATEASKKSYTDQVIGLTSALPEDEPNAPKHAKGLSGKCGVTIAAADLETIELTGSHKDEYQSAAGAAFTAEQHAMAKVTTAMAEASEIQLTGKARADVTVAQGKADAEALKARAEVAKESPQAMELARYDGLIEASKGDGAHTIWANNPFSGK